MMSLPRFNPSRRPTVRVGRKATGNPVVKEPFKASTSSVSDVRQVLPVRLIAFVLVSQLFDYKSWNFPASKLVFTVTPDRFFLVLLFFLVASRFLTGRFQVRSIS